MFRLLKIKLEPDNQSKSFYFPFLMDENSSLEFKEVPKGATLFDTKYYLHEWYKVIVSPLIWKNQDSLLVKINKNRSN